MLLTTEKLSKAYKSRKKGEPVFWAAKEVCVEIPEGKTVGLLGPSGSGKSTVGQMIVGLIEASSGEIFYKGERLSYPLKGELRKKIQILFQHPEVSFNPMLPLIRSMVEPYKLMKKDSSEKAILADIERFGLHREHLYRTPLELSGGEPETAKLVQYWLTPEITEQKLTGNKAVFKGVLVFKALLLGADGTPQVMSRQLPLSQYCELRGDYADDELQVQICVTGSEAELVHMEDEPRSTQAKNHPLWHTHPR